MWGLREAGLPQAQHHLCLLDCFQELPDPGILALQSRASEKRTLHIAITRATLLLWHKATKPTTVPVTATSQGCPDTAGHLPTPVPYRLN